MQQHGEILFGDVWLSIAVRVSSNCSVNQHSFGLLPSPLVKPWQRARGEEVMHSEGKRKDAFSAAPRSLLSFHCFLLMTHSVPVCPLVFICYFVVHFFKVCCFVLLQFHCVVCDLCFFNSPLYCFQCYFFKFYTFEFKFIIKPAVFFNPSIRFCITWVSRKNLEK